MKGILVAALPLLLACTEAEVAPSPAAAKYTQRQRNTLNPTSTPLDAAVRARVRRYRAGDVAARAGMRVEPSDVDTFAIFAQRAAVFGMRERDTQWVDDGLSAIAMLDKVSDGMGSFDLNPTIAMLHHAAGRGGGNAAALFRGAAAIAHEPGVADALRDFPSDPEMAKIAAWQLEEVPTGFIRHGTWDYAPARDLRRAIIEISGVVDRDGYEVVQVAVAENFPGPPAGARGVATFFTSPQRSLTVYLVELPDPAAATALRNASRPGATVAISRGDLFCLIRAEENAGETLQKLQRFVAPVERVLDAAL